MTKSKRPRDAKATQRDLLSAASEAFANRGFDGARTQKIADAAGVNKALIRYYYGGKQGLYSAVILHHVTRAQATIDAALDTAMTPPERLEAFLVALGRAFDEQSDLAPIIMREQMDGARRLEAEVRDRFFGFFGRMREILEQGMKGGFFRRLDPHATHLSLVGSLVMYRLTEPARRTYVEQGATPGPIPGWPDYVDHVRRLFAAGLEPETESGAGGSPVATEQGE